MEDFFIVSMDKSTKKIAKSLICFAESKQFSLLLFHIYFPFAIPELTMLDIYTDFFKWRQNAPQHLHRVMHMTFY
jgi:hypothetical protein